MRFKKECGMGKHHNLFMVISICLSMPLLSWCIDAASEHVAENKSSQESSECVESQELSKSSVPPILSVLGSVQAINRLLPSGHCTDPCDPAPVVTDEAYAGKFDGATAPQQTAWTSLQNAISAWETRQNMWCTSNPCLCSQMPCETCCI